MTAIQKYAERLREVGIVRPPKFEGAELTPGETRRLLWEPDELRAAIGRCEDEVARLVAEHARPEAIYSRRQGIDVLYILLREAERGERHGPAGESERTYGSDERSHVL